jgi:hypothetical protein
VTTPLPLSPKGAGEPEGTFAYDAPTGRLTQDNNPAGGETNLSLTGVMTYNVTKTTALGRTTQFNVDNSVANMFSEATTEPDGTQLLHSIAQETQVSTTAPDGTVTATTRAGDPRFGMLSPVTSSSVTTPAGLVMQTSETAR